MMLSAQFPTAYKVLRLTKMVQDTLEGNYPASYVRNDRHQGGRVSVTHTYTHKLHALIFVGVGGRKETRKKSGEQGTREEVSERTGCEGGGAGAVRKAVQLSTFNMLWQQNMNELSLQRHELLEMWNVLFINV
jgi:hypothetical protein